MTMTAVARAAQALQLEPALDRFNDGFGTTFQQQHAMEPVPYTAKNLLYYDSSERAAVALTDSERAQQVQACLWSERCVLVGLGFDSMLQQQHAMAWCPSGLSTKCLRGASERAAVALVNADVHSTFDCLHSAARACLRHFHTTPA